eukprot:6038807-Amphidinium_carterae.2
MDSTWQELEYAVNDFLNIYLYNYPPEFPQAGQHLLQPHYLVVLHTTERLVAKLKEDLKNIQSRNPGWYTRKTFDYQFQIHGDRVQQATDRAIKIGDYIGDQDNDLTENEINKAYDYFDERAQTLFDRPNIRNLTSLPQLREEQRDYSENEDDEEDENDEYDTSRQSTGTTRASESHMKPRMTKGRGKTIGERRPLPGSIVTTRKSPTATPWRHR